ncbi:MAG: endonuclease MutS2, partial [Anaerolineae bacterium]|nr:endonuclease MutS2 [Anaerolineae bacterium]
RLLFEQKTNISLGGVFDVRDPVLTAQRGVVIEPTTLLDILSTLRRGSTVRRILTRLKGQAPRLAQIAELIEECSAVQQEIATVINDRGEVLDTASPRLAIIRRDMKVALDRLQSKLQNIVSNPNNQKYLQESLITQRNGRYVIPLRAEFKGRIKGIVHDQSSSGATLWIEPLTTVEHNNTYRELQIEEQEEVRRILRELTALIGRESDFIIRTVEILSGLDLILARARYAEAIEATAPQLVGFRSMPETDGVRHPGSTLNLAEARHPLLDPRTVVPIDVYLDDETFVLVITGPNTGGKTVALKTVGLLALMAQCGMHLPVKEGARLSVFEGVFADIGDEQSIEQSLSTFSAHMTNTIRIIEACDAHSLVILDEVGAGTDPAEGAALARAILSALLRKSTTTLVTTHHPELKVWSHEQRGVRNASVVFDLNTLAPTYQLVIGLPGRSNALAIASRLGMDSAIIEEARGMIATESMIADDLLDEIHKTRDEIRREKTAAAVIREEADELRQELQDRLDNIEAERRDLMNSARQEIMDEMEELRAEMRRMRRRLQAAGQPLEAIREVEGTLEDLDRAVAEPVPNKVAQAVEGLEDRPLHLGDPVWVHTLGTEGVITELSRDEAEVQIGRLRLRARLDDLTYRTRSERKTDERPTPRHGMAPSSTPPPPTKSPGLELDLRGSRVEDAVTQLEEYLDAAYMAGLPFVRIIHGKGTGALRKAVQDMVGAHPLTRRWERGRPNEGGDGVTVVFLASQN